MSETVKGTFRDKIPRATPQYTCPSGRVHQSQLFPHSVMLRLARKHKEARLLIVPYSVERLLPPH